MADSPDTQVGVLHLHTYFFFPFSIDKPFVADNHPESWKDKTSWIDGVDDWILAHHRADSAIVKRLGGWKRAAYTRFDMESPAYQDMVFFHPFVRRVFFDTAGPGGESLLRGYCLPVDQHRVYF